MPHPLVGVPPRTGQVLSDGIQIHVLEQLPQDDVSAEGVAENGVGEALREIGIRITRYKHEPKSLFFTTEWIG